MMQSLLTIKDAVTGALKAMDKSILLLTENEWKMLTAVAEILKPFHDITTELSSQYYPSLSKVIPSIRILLQNLGTVHLESNLELLPIFEMKSDLTNNIRDRFHLTMDNSTAHLVSTFLDPR